MSQQCSIELLVDATVAGITYRKLFCYDMSTINNFQSLKTRVIDDLKAAGAPLENAADVVLRNYTLTAYEYTPFSSAGARSCALSDKNSWGCEPGVKSSRLLAAEPSPQIPIGPAIASRHAMLAIAARQIYDRAFGRGLVLPLEARVKPLATQGLSAAEATDSPVQPAGETQGPPSESIAAAVVHSGKGIDSEPFEITVRDFRGRFHAVRVCGDTSVSRLKAGIAASLGCSVVSHWRLLYEGRPLDDELDLADYSILAGALVEVQMTSRLPYHLKTRTGAVSSALDLSEDKDGANSTSSMVSADAKAAGAAAPNCSAPWAGPGVKDTAAAQKLVVQVLLPCGRIVQVPRNVAEDVQHFVYRVLETQKALLQAPTVQPDGPLPLQPLQQQQPQRSRGPLRGRLPACIKRRGGPPGGLEALSGQQSCGANSTSNARQTVTQQLKGGAIGQKLLVLLLTAAAVVVAMAVL